MAEIGVRFMLRGEMLKDGEMDVAAFSLALDGEDVTAKTDRVPSERTISTASSEPCTTTAGSPWTQDPLASSS
jgi:hypothetical protein